MDWGGLVYLGAALSLVLLGLFLGFQTRAAQVKLLENENARLTEALEASRSHGQRSAQATGDVLTNVRERGSVPPTPDGVRLLFPGSRPRQADPPERGAS